GIHPSSRVYPGACKDRGGCDPILLETRTHLAPSGRVFSVLSRCAPVFGVRCSVFGECVRGRVLTEYRTPQRSDEARSAVAAVNALRDEDSPQRPCALRASVRCSGDASEVGFLDRTPNTQAAGLGRFGGGGEGRGSQKLSRKPLAETRVAAFRSV